MRGLAVLALQLGARGLWLWVLARLLLAVALGMAGSPPLPTGPGAVTLMVPILAGIGLADVARRRERAWLDVLGIGRGGAVSVFVAAALAGELLLASTR